VLNDEMGSFRVLLDGPRAIEFSGAMTSPDRIVISTVDGPFELRMGSSVRRRHTRRSADSKLNG